MEVTNFKLERCRFSFTVKTRDKTLKALLAWNNSFWQQASWIFGIIAGAVVLILFFTGAAWILNRLGRCLQWPFRAGEMMGLTGAKKEPTAKAVGPVIMIKTDDDGTTTTAA